MKATGIVRRIDDLGRVVIPKEIRRTLRIREGDPLEIFTGKEGEVVFKKYAPIRELTEVASEFAAALQSVCGSSCVVADRERVIACGGPGKREVLEREISESCETMINDRRSFKADGGQGMALLKDREDPRLAAAWPILAGGDLVGMIGLLDNGKGVSTAEEKALQTGALFLGRQMEG